MWWVLVHALASYEKQFEAQKGDGNKLAMKSIIDSGEVPGILAYHNIEAIGWCAIAPRAAIQLYQDHAYFSQLMTVHVGLLPVCLLKSHIEKKAFLLSFYELQLNMAKSQGAELVERLSC